MEDGKEAEGSQGGWGRKEAGPETVRVTQFILIAQDNRACIRLILGYILNSSPNTAKMIIR